MWLDPLLTAWAIILGKIKIFHISNSKKISKVRLGTQNFSKYPRSEILISILVIYTSQRGRPLITWFIFGHFWSVKISFWFSFWIDLNTTLSQGVSKKKNIQNWAINLRFQNFVHIPVPVCKGNLWVETMLNPPPNQKGGITFKVSLQFLVPFSRNQSFRVLLIKKNLETVAL